MYRLICFVGVRARIRRWAADSSAPRMHQHTGLAARRIDARRAPARRRRADGEPRRAKTTTPSRT